MASVRVPLADFTAGTLPNVCALSGTIARNNFGVAATSSNGPVVGAVPLTAAAVKAMRALQRLTFGLFGLSLLVMMVGVMGQSGVWGALSFLTLFVAVASLIYTAKRNLKAKVDGNDVILDHVHPDFARAITAPMKRCEGCSGAGSCSTAEKFECEQEPAEA